MAIQKTEPAALRYYYVSASNEAQGPFDGHYIGELIHQAVISRETLIAAEGESSWTPLAQRPEWVEGENPHAVPTESARDTVKSEQAENNSVPFGQVMHDFARTLKLGNKSPNSGYGRK